LYGRALSSVISNGFYRGKITFAGKPYKELLKGKWADERLNTIFPPEVREFSKTDMHQWDKGSLVIESGQAIPEVVDTLPEYARLSNARFSS